MFHFSTCIWSSIFSLNRERFFNISNGFSTSLLLSAANSSSSSSVSSASLFSVCVVSCEISWSVSVDDVLLLPHPQLQNLQLSCFLAPGLVLFLITLSGSRECSIRWQKKKKYVWQILNNWLGWAIVNVQCYFSSFGLFTSLTHSSNKTLSIQLFLYDWYLQGSFLIFLKDFGLFALLTTNINSLLPTALAPANPVILILMCLPPGHFLLFWGIASLALFLACF